MRNERGWVKRGYFNEELDEAAFALEAGQVSEVIEDATHFRILKVVERKEGTPPPLDEAREKIVAALKEESRAAHSASAGGRVALSLRLRRVRGSRRGAVA